MILKIHIHSGQKTSKQPITVNIFLNSNENDGEAATQDAIQLPPEIHYPDPSRTHHAEAISSIPTLPSRHESGFETATNTPKSFRSRFCNYGKHAKWRQRYIEASWLSLSRHLPWGLWCKAQDAGSNASCCSARSDGKFHKAARRNIHANRHTPPCHPKLATVNFGLDFRNRSCRSKDDDQPRSQGEESDYSKSVAAVFPVREPHRACIDPLAASYRRIEILVWKLDGDVIAFFATMDTGADLNVMTLERAELLGCGTVDQNSGTMLKGIGEKPTLSLGTVRIKFSLRCNSKERWVVFHLVHDLGGHQALLGVGLTMELKHLHRPRCMECERAMPRPV